MVNAVMDAIALLSSLATDLDIMLNDLRSSPSTRLLPPSQLPSNSQQQHPQQQHQLQQQQRYSANPAQSSPGCTDAGSYLSSAFRSTSYGQQHSATTATTSTPTVTATHFNRQQHVRSSAAARTQNHNPNRNQQRLNQDCCKLHESRALHVAESGTSGSSGNGSTATGIEPHTGRSGGLSAEVRQIQKLPLWSYQQRQLQQPQKLHVQLLQQHQQATKAIASQTTADAFANSKSNAVKTKMTTTSTSSMMTNSTASFYGSGTNDNNNNNNHGRGRSSNSNSNSSWLQAATCLLSNSRDRDSKW